MNNSDIADKLVAESGVSKADARKTVDAVFEPRRVCRRRWVVSHAAISRLSAAA